ncbi:MAG: hypothetical protein ACRDPH_11095 [Marmoricola sp.]
MNLHRSFHHSRPPVPDVVPILSRGRHRTPTKGACFMELASYLAGERWSDHPQCTHPALGALAREVNDHVDDTHRRELVPMVPDVIGTTTEDPHVMPLLARACALAVLDVASDHHHDLAAVTLLRSEAALDAIDGRASKLSSAAHTALSSHPGSRTWARSFTARVGTGHPGKPAADRRAAAAAIRTAVVALGVAPDGATRLVSLLREAIEICRSHAGPASVTGVVPDTADHRDIR